MSALYVVADSKDLGANLTNVVISDTIDEINLADTFYDGTLNKTSKCWKDFKYVTELFYDSEGLKRDRTHSITFIRDINVSLNSKTSVYSEKRDFILSPDIGGPNERFNTFGIRPYSKYQKHREHFCWRKIEAHLKLWMLSNYKLNFIIKVTLSYPERSDIPILITYKIAVLDDGPYLVTCSEKKKLIKLIKECDDSFSGWDLVPVVGNVRTIGAGVRNIKKGETIVGSVKVALGISFLVADAVTLGQLGSFVKGLTTGAFKLGAGAVAKEAVKTGGKEAVTIAAQEIGKNVGKEATKEIAAQASKELGKKVASQAAKEVGMKAATQATQEIGKKAAKELGKKAAQEVATQATKEFGKKAVQELGKKAAQEVATQATKEIGKKAAQELGKKAAQEVASQAAQEIGKKVATQAAQEIGKKAATQAAQEIGKKAAKELGKKAASQAAQEIGKKAATQAAQEIGKKAAEELGKKAASQAAQEMGKKAATQAAQEIGKKAAKELGKKAASQAAQEIGKKAATQAAQEIGKKAASQAAQEMGKKAATQAAQEIGKKAASQAAQEMGKKAATQAAQEIGKKAAAQAAQEMGKKAAKEVAKGQVMEILITVGSKLEKIPVKKIGSALKGVQVLIESDAGKKAVNFLEENLRRKQPACLEKNANSNNEIAHQIFLVGNHFHPEQSLTDQVEEFLLEAFGETVNIINVTFLKEDIICITCSNTNEIQQLLRLNRKLEFARSDAYFTLFLDF